MCRKLTPPIVTLICGVLSCESPRVAYTPTEFYPNTYRSTDIQIIFAFHRGSERRGNPEIYPHRITYVVSIDCHNGSPHGQLDGSVSDGQPLNIQWPGECSDGPIEVDVDYFANPLRGCITEQCRDTNMMRSRPTLVCPFVCTAYGRR